MNKRTIPLSICTVAFFAGMVFADLNSEIRTSDAAIEAAQKALTDRCSLADYAALAVVSITVSTSLASLMCAPAASMRRFDLRTTGESMK